MIEKNVTVSFSNENEQLRKVEDVTLMSFGNGEISVGSIINKPQLATFVFFETVPAAKIGSVPPQTNNEPEVIMVFTKPESIDVVINKLLEAKQALIDYAFNKHLEE